MSPQALSTAADSPPIEDRILVVGGSPATIDLLRLATIRSEDVLLVAMTSDRATTTYVDRFALERQERSAEESDLAGAASILVALDDPQLENRIVRAARQRRIPVFVSGRPLVSDFTLLEFLERRPSATAS